MVNIVPVHEFQNNKESLRMEKELVLVAEKKVLRRKQVKPVSGIEKLQRAWKINDASFANSSWPLMSL